MTKDTWGRAKPKDYSTMYPVLLWLQELVWYWCKDTQIDKQNRIENSETDSYI